MDKLSHLIEQEVRRKNWKAIKIWRYGAMISHLMFADDLLLFGEATEKQIKCVMHTLKLFCSMSGKEVRHEKTSVVFFKNVTMSMQMKLSQLSQYRVNNSFGKYLRVSLSGRRLKRKYFQYIEDQIVAKLTRWKRNSISFVGKVTLAKSVIVEIPLYPMMTNRLPKSCIEDIHRL